MHPIALFRCAPGDGPGRFAEFLDERKIPWILFALDSNESVPVSAKTFSGIAIMGGPMSANDDLIWIPQILNLIKDAVDSDIPVIGHCLGGQLLSKALGGVVTENPVKEIGWNTVDVEDNHVAKIWLGEYLKSFTTFQWHQDTFTIPPNADRILTGRYCSNQAYVVNNKHLGMQCHVEITNSIIKRWCETGVSEINESKNSPAVQSVEEIIKNTPKFLPILTNIAISLYSQWIKGLKS